MMMPGGSYLKVVFERMANDYTVFYDLCHFCLNNFKSNSCVYVCVGERDVWVSHTLLMG